MLPIPPLDGGNVLSGLLPYRFAATFNQIRPYGFLLLYALLLTDGFYYLVVQPSNVSPFLADVKDRARVVSGHATDRSAASRTSGRRARQLGAAARAIRLLLLRRGLACPDERFRRYQSAHLVRLRKRGRLDRRGPRSREEHLFRSVARAGTRRALSPLVDGRAGAVARTSADLQGAAGDPQGQGSFLRRLSELPAAADGRRRHVRRAVRARRRRSGRPSGTGPRGRAPLQQRLRPGRRRCSSSRSRC